MKRFSVGVLGARTSKFKTVRYDEITLQKYGITCETFDLSDLIWRVGQYADDDKKVLERKEHLKNYTDFSLVPDDKITTLSKVSVVIDDYIEEYRLNAVTLRCWEEMQTVLGVAPCVLLSELNDRGIVTSCEIAPIMLFMADRASVPVCVHLDHGTDLDYVKKGLRLGFTSVMYDGSTLPDELNFANTSIAVEMAKKTGASVEAEIGSMGARESGESSGDSTIPHPKQQRDFPRRPRSTRLPVHSARCTAFT